MYIFHIFLEKLIKATTHPCVAFLCVGAATDMESSKRAAFDVNVAAIVAHNTLADAGVKTYRLGVNEFSDLTEEDFATHYLDAGYKARKAASSADRATREVWLGGIANPATLDWRTKGAVTQVKNQGQKKGKTRIKQKTMMLQLYFRTFSGCGEDLDLAVPILSFRKSRTPTFYLDHLYVS